LYDTGTILKISGQHANAKRLAKINRVIAGIMLLSHAAIKIYNKMLRRQKLKATKLRKKI